MEEPPAGLGETRDELRRILGEPTDASVPTRSQRQPMIWRYGEVEYHFRPDGTSVAGLYRGRARQSAGTRQAPLGMRRLPEGRNRWGHR